MLTLHCTPSFSGAWEVGHELWASHGGVMVVPDEGAVRRALARTAAAPPGVAFDREAVTWNGLRDRILRATGTPQPEQPSRVAIRLALQDAVHTTPLAVLASSSRGPGFLTALERALAEIREAGVTADVLLNAAADPVSSEVALLLAGVAVSGHPADARWAAVGAAEQLTEHAPVIACGLDDLAPTAWELLLRLGTITEVHAVLPYEPGRVGHAARHARHRRWTAQAAVVRDHRGGEGVDSVVFEDRAPVTDARAIIRVGASGTRGMHRAALLALISVARGGVPLSSCALVVPRLAVARDDLDRLLADWEVPARRMTRRRVMETPLGLALTHLLRLGVADTDAPGALRALMGWLRSPYSGADAGEVDDFERDARRAGLDSRRALIGRWGDVLGPARRLAAAAAHGPRAQLAALVEVGEQALGRRPVHGLPTDADVLDRRALVALAGLSADLGDVPDEDGTEGRGRGPLPPGEIGALIADLTVRDERGDEGGLAVLDYASLRGRSFHTVALCGLDGDGVPGAPPPDALLGVLRSAPGSCLPDRAPGTSEARLRFVHALGAATDGVVLVRRVADDEGRPVAPSPFWMEACRAAGIDPGVLDVRPPHDGEVVDVAAGAPSTQEALRRLALDGHVADGALARAASRRTRSLGLRPGALDGVTEISVTGVESFLACGYGWFHDRYLRPAALEAPFDAAAEGSLGHAVMAAVYQWIAEGPDPGPCTIDRLPMYRAALERCLAEVLAAERPNRTSVGFDAFGRRLAVHLDLLLANEAASGPRMRPVAFEEQVRDEVFLDATPPLTLTGTLDRLDVDATHAVVIDYKRSGRTYRGTEDLAKRLQPPLYGHLASAARGLTSAGGLYVALLGGSRDGLVRDDADYADSPPRVVAGAEWDAMVDEAVAAARGVAADLRAGRLAGPPTAGCPPWCGCGALWR